MDASSCQQSCNTSCRTITADLPATMEKKGPSIAAYFHLSMLPPAEGSLGFGALSSSSSSSSLDLSCSFLSALPFCQPEQDVRSAAGVNDTYS